jgi:hypothetical protein
MTRPYTTPQLAYKVRAGKPGSYLHDCQQDVETHDRVDHKDDLVIVRCADGVELELKGVYLR